MECGECTICCEIVEVSGRNFHKPAGTLCSYCKGGCTIYGQEDRPVVCGAFQCAWLRGYGSEEDRPDKSNVMVSISAFNGGRWIFVMETKKDAYKTTGKGIIKDIVSRVNLPVIVSAFESKPGEDYGDFVILKDSLQPRAKTMLGDFMFEFSDNVNVYELNR